MSVTPYGLRILLLRTSRTSQLIFIFFKGDADMIVQNAAKRCLSRRRKKMWDKKGKLEPPWMNENIRNEIKKRRKFNREKRPASGERLQILSELYKEQKQKVKRLVREVKGEYERKVAREVKENKTNEKMWNMIRKLRGDSERNNMRCELWEGEGLVVREEEEAEKMMDGWKEIYQGAGNRMREVWDNNKEEYQGRWVRGIEQDRERRNEVASRVIGLPRIGGLEAGRYKGLDGGSCGSRS